MKKRTKIWLVIAIILALTGGAMCFAAFAMGLNYKDLTGMAHNGLFHFDDWWDDGYEHKKINASKENDQTDSVNSIQTDKPEALMIDLDYGMLTIRSTDRQEAYLEVEKTENEKHFKLHVNNDSIRVNTPDDVIGIHLHVPEATLYIPENTSFDYIEISVDAGECSIQTALDTLQLHVDADAGNVSISKMYADWLEFDCDAGNIRYEGQAISGGTIDVDAGNVELSVNGKNMEDYNYDMEVSVGELKINDQNFSGLNGRHAIENQASGTWMLCCDLGKIQLNVEP